jgi:hypothetical protein
VHPPDTADWLSVLALWTALAAGVRASPPSTPVTAEASKMIAPFWTAAVAIAAVPAIVAAAAAPPWTTVAWWTALGLPAAVTLVRVFGVPAAWLSRRQEWKGEPSDPVKLWTYAVLAGTAMLVVVAGVVTAAVEYPAAWWPIPLGLICGYALSRVCQTLVRRWSPSPHGDASTTG